VAGIEGILSPAPRVDGVSAANTYEIDPLGDPRWSSLIENHPRASVFHSTNWLRALRIVYGYESVAITTCPPGSPLTNGLVFCRIKSWLTGRRFVSLPFSDHCESLVSDSAELDDLLLPMKRYVDGKEWRYIAIRPVSYAPSERTRFVKSLTYCLHRLDLSISDKELFHNFHKDCVQRKIRRAERESLRDEEGTSEILLQRFYKLLVMTRRRQKLPPQPLNWFRGLIAVFGKDLKIRVAYKDHLPVASILTLSHKKSMTYKYGCSNAAFNKLGGVAFLFWKAIQDAKGNGLDELDMGRSDADNLGLIAFKEHWGAAATVLNYWVYPDHAAGYPRGWQERLVRQMVSGAPDVALMTLGKLLYRHIG